MKRLNTNRWEQDVFSTSRRRGLVSLFNWRINHPPGIIVIVVRTLTRVQILDEAFCISNSANTLGKAIDPTILSSAMGK